MSLAASGRSPRRESVAFVTSSWEALSSIDFTGFRTRIVIDSSPVNVNRWRSGRSSRLYLSGRTESGRRCVVSGMAMSVLALSVVEAWGSYLLTATPASASPGGARTYVPLPDSRGSGGRRPRRGDRLDVPADSKAPPMAHGELRPDEDREPRFHRIPILPSVRAGVGGLLFRFCPSERLGPRSPRAARGRRPRVRSSGRVRPP